MGNCIKNGVVYVVKLLPIAIELVERYKGENKKKSSPDKVFSVCEYQTMVYSLRVLTRKCGCSTEITPHIGRHTFAVLAILKGMPQETLQKVLGHKSILSTQIYAELINPKVGEDTDKLCMKIGDVYRLTNSYKTCNPQIMKQKMSFSLFVRILSFLTVPCAAFQPQVNQY